MQSNFPPKYWCPFFPSSGFAFSVPELWRNATQRSIFSVIPQSLPLSSSGAQVNPAGQVSRILILISIKQNRVG